MAPASGGRSRHEAPRRVQLACQQREHSTSTHRQQRLSTTRMGEAITAALAEADSADRAELAAWAARRFLLAVAHQRGPSEAARVAYEAADILAVAA